MSAEAPAIRVYIVHWNAPEWLRSTIQSFLGSTIETSVTVIDNGPYDRPLVLDPRVHVVRSGANLGYTGAANMAIADWLAGSDEFCVVANHDVTLEPEALALVLDAARNNPEFGILAPRPVENISGGRVLVASDSLDERSWVSGTLMVLRRQCIEAMGGFDEAFGSYGEDVDLCMRARDTGWKVGVVKHAQARARGSVDPGFRVQMYVNQIRLRLKHAGIRQAAKMIIAFPLLSVADLGRLLVRRDQVFLRRSVARLRAIPQSVGLLLAARRS